MANKQISDQPTKTTAGASDYILIRDVAASSDKKTTVAGIATAVAANLPAASVASTSLVQAFVKGRQRLAGVNTDQTGQLMQWGTEATSNFASAGDLNVAVTFPTPYAGGTVPFVTIAAQHSQSALDGVWATLVAVSNTGATFRAHVNIHGSAAPVTIHWHAIGTP